MGHGGARPLLLRSGSAPMVGRDAELAVLLDAVEHAPSVVFVEGPAGVGKTRLVAEFAAAVRARGVRVLVGACQPLPEPFPYGVLFDCLSQCGDHLDDPGPVTGALRDHLPELAGLLPPAPRALGDPDAERHRIFRAVHELLRSLGATVLVLEDLHWADEETRWVLRFVLASPPPGLSIVTTYRREDLPTVAPFGYPSHVPHGVTGVNLVLGPLGVADVRAMIDALVAEEVTSDRFAEAVLRETAGIPFMVEETVRALRDPTVDVRAEGDRAQLVLDRIDVPVPVSDAIAERLGNLPDAARSVAEAAAVLGVPETADVLSAVADQPEVAHLIRLTKSTVLVEEPANRFGFRDNLARRAVCASLPGPRRRELHERALAALSTLDRVPAGRLSVHAKAAGRKREWLRYSELAAEAAEDVKDVALAVDLLSEVLADPEISVEDTNRLAIKLCGYALMGLPGGVVTTRVESLLSDPRLAPDVRGEVHLWFGLLLQRETGTVDRGADQLARAIDLLADQPQRTVRGLAAMAGPYLGTASIAEHRTALGRVETITDHLPTQALRTVLLATTLGGRLIIGDSSTWERVAQLPSPSEVHDPDEIHHLARAHCNLADACSWIGHYPRARKFLRSGITLAERAAASYVLGTAEATAVRLDWLDGQWSGLEQRIDRLVETYANLLLTTDLNLTRGWLAAARGEWARAERAFEATGSYPLTQVFPVGVSAAGGMAGMLLSQGKVTAAEEHVERGVGMLRSKGAWVWSGDLLPQAVDFYLAMDRVDAARRLVAETIVGLGGVDAPLAHAALTGCRARLAAVTDDRGEADRLYREAIGLHHDLGLPYRATQLAEQAEDGATANVTVLEVLAESYESLGATVDAARCRHRIRGAGVATPSRRGRRGYGDELSPREHDVARLLAGGHTNREIAQALFLSRRTVEDYVAKVCRKLNAPSRHDVRL
ncbi:helix-turn-helix transcriptional regulator [Amycolatopsis coloradensis]|uniref:Helix-turn-helix transcriptional regulator n=1 Tax=Amycolatopsis coloradensis TaxID=76021 RepID=A0A1R0KQZ0_9PSEU|nr:LuxR family transcriptional regulator [Amycolatopsis coloradensis]OLZ50043.1 helix-turn-helix transcriptional regulator [Amycolatopsis coloradensis]